MWWRLWTRWRSFLIKLPNNAWPIISSDRCGKYSCVSSNSLAICDLLAYLDVCHSFTYFAFIPFYTEFKFLIGLDRDGRRLTNCIIWLVLPNEGRRWIRQKGALHAGIVDMRHHVISAWVGAAEEKISFKIILYVIYLSEIPSVMQVSSIHQAYKKHLLLYSVAMICHKI